MQDFLIQFSVQFTKSVPLFCLIGLGYALVRWCGFGKTESNAVVKFAFNVSLDGIYGENTFPYDLQFDSSSGLYEALSKMKEITDGLGVKYTNDEVIKKEEDTTITDNSIYFDNENIYLLFDN